MDISPKSKKEKAKSFAFEAAAAQAGASKAKPQSQGLKTAACWLSVSDTPRHFTSSLFPCHCKPPPTSCSLVSHSGTRKMAVKQRWGKVEWGIRVLATLKEGHCLWAYPGRDAEGLNLPQPILSAWERDLRETRTTKTVCDKAAAPLSERSEIKCDIFHLFVNASLAAHSHGTTVGLLPS